MAKRLLASFALVFFVGITPASGHSVFANTRNCNKLFTISMGERAANAIYRGTRKVSLQNLKLLGYIERCQRDPRDQALVRAYDRHQDKLWKIRKTPPAPPRSSVLHISSTGWSPPWTCIAHFESGSNPAENTGNGYYGGLQFDPGTWISYGGVPRSYPYAAAASISEQEAIAERVLARQGWGAWPNTSRMCGL